MSSESAVRTMVISDEATFVFVQSDGTEIQAHRHQNDDGSPGGWVAENASVHAKALVELHGLVWPGAVVGPEEVVSGNRFAEGIFP